MLDQGIETFLSGFETVLIVFFISICIVREIRLCNIEYLMFESIE